MKIYISPSMQQYNKYAAGNTTEAEQCHRIGEYAAAALKRCGFDVKLADAKQTAEQNVAESNAWGADYHVCIHTNAASGNARDVVVFTSDKNTADKCAVGVYNAIDVLDNHTSVYGVRPAGYYEIKATKAKCIYIEAEFHDVVSLAAWIIDNVERIGEAIAKGFCTGAGVKYIQKENKMNEKEVKALLSGEGSEVSAWAKAELEAAMGNGITDGSRPLGYTTRQETAIMVQRAVEKIEKRLDKMADDVTDKIVGKILAGLKGENE